jgi:hypothetical protein
MNPYSAVGIATNHELDYRGVGVRVLVGAKIFLSPRNSNQFRGPIQLHIQWERGPFHGVQAAGA